jgi:hypothetical protein
MFGHFFKYFKLYYFIKLYNWSFLHCIVIVSLREGFVTIYCTLIWHLMFSADILYGNTILHMYCSFTRHENKPLHDFAYFQYQYFSTLCSGLGFLHIMTLDPQISESVLISCGIDNKSVLVQNVMVDHVSREYYIIYVEEIFVV